MAITWTATITPISIPDKTISIYVVRDEDGVVSEYDVAKATIDTVTMANNIPILDEIWAKRQAHLTEESNIDDFVSALEILAKTNLEARE